MTMPAAITNELADEITSREWDFLEEGRTKDFVDSLRGRSGLGVASCHAVWLGLRGALGYAVPGPGPGEG